MKQNRTLTFIMLLLIALELSACSAQKLSGKYINIYDETNYLIFNEDGSFINNGATITSKGNTSIADFYVYKIEENGLITIIDTTEYEGQDSLNEYQLGILYQNYICSLWNGTLSKTYEDTIITSTLGNEYLLLTYNFKKDKSYEHTVTLNNEIIHTENGTYAINGKEVVCTSEEGVVTTFIGAEDKVFCIEYVKE